MQGQVDATETTENWPGHPGWQNHSGFSLIFFSVNRDNILNQILFWIERHK